MSLPLCTIVIPAYNAGMWVDRTLQSAAQQTYPNLEVLVVDDGSTDNTRDLAEAFAAKDDRFRVLSIPNGGVANARNVGTREARGELVAFLDADDLWHPEKVSLQVAAIQQPIGGALPAASYTLMRSIDVDDYVIDVGSTLELSGFVRARHLYFKPVGNGSSILVRREIALELGGYDPSWAARGIGGCEDVDFEIKIAAKYPIACVPQLLVGYRLSPGNMSSNRLRMARGFLGVVDRHVHADPQLPDWVKRQVYAATLEYSSLLLLRGLYWQDAFQHLAKLIRADQKRAAVFLVRTLLSYNPRRITGIVRQRFFRKPFENPNRSSGKALFAELGPELNPAQRESKLGRRDQKLLKALTVVDEQMWRERSR